MLAGSFFNTFSRWIFIGCLLNSSLNFFESALTRLEVNSDDKELSVDWECFNGNLVIYN